MKKSAPPRIKPTNVPIASDQRAYELWEACGCPHGEDTAHWLQAERDVQARREKKKI
jgi:hypothetical protein